MTEHNPLSGKNLADWADQLQAVARNGLFFAADEYDKERYERILKISSEMLGGLTGISPLQVEGLLAREVGYATPKIGVLAAVFDDRGDILLIERADSGLWSPPGGWAEVGETAASSTAREVLEETGLIVRPTRLLGLYDTRKHGSLAAHHSYNVSFWCTVVGGEPSRTKEALDFAYFDRLDLPLITKHHQQPVVDAFAAVRDGRTEVVFDL